MAPENVNREQAHFDAALVRIARATIALAPPDASPASFCAVGDGPSRFYWAPRLRT